MGLFRVVGRHHGGVFAPPGQRLLLIGMSSSLEAWPAHRLEMGHSAVDGVEPRKWIRHRVLVLLVVQRRLHLPAWMGLLFVLHGLLVLVLLSVIWLDVIRVVV